MTSRKKILIIDDEENMRHFLKSMLVKEGYDVLLAAGGRDGLEQLEQQEVATVLCDVRMPGMDGLEFLRAVSRKEIATTVITMSAYGTIDLAIETMKLGAYDYISKPFKPPEILLTLKKAEERERLKKENVRLRKEVNKKYSFNNIVGKSPQMMRVFDIVRKVAAFKSSVLITGESGTGKELVAKAIHYNSPRRNQTFLAINCGAIPGSLLESELFGHKRGSFTGASRDRKGFFEEADEGTLFLDEIGDIPKNLQVKLLRALQEGEIQRIGDEHPVSVDVRVIAATAKDLLSEVQRALFREDLFYRLNVLPIHIPPLRERPEDIPLLAEHFIKKYNRNHGLSISGLTPAALDRLIGSSWPGNIRELENVIERSMVLADGPMIEAGDLPDLPAADRGPEGYRVPDGEFSIKKLSRIMEEQLIRKALHKTRGNKSRAAKLLELSYPALLSKIGEYGIIYDG